MAYGPQRNIACRSDEYPVDPILRRLWPCRQRLGGFPDAAPRLRGLGRSIRCSSPTTPATAPGRAASMTGRWSTSWSRASQSAASCRAATASSPAIWARPISAMPSCPPSRGCARPIRAATYCCDPVIGDVGRGVFVRPGIAEFMREQAVPAADVITPNQFELDLLAGLATPRLADAKTAIAAVQALGPSVDPRHLADDRGNARRRHRPPRRRRAAASGACARRGSTSASTARATPSRPCSTCIGSARARPPRRSPRPAPRSTAC